MYKNNASAWRKVQLTNAIKIKMYQTTGKLKKTFIEAGIPIRKWSQM